MPQLKTHLDIYQILPQTNCKECGFPACLAFAVAVNQGKKSLTDCPYIGPEVLGQYEVEDTGGPAIEEDTRRNLEHLRQEFSKIDLADAAARLGAEYHNGEITVRCLGKPFTLDGDGELFSTCHANVWVLGPLLNYIIHGKGVEPSGQWVPLRDLPGGLDWGRFFGHRCEAPLKKVVDGYFGLMQEIIDVFGGQPAPDMFDSDIAVIVHPLPKLPMLICYWQPEDGLESQLNLFFDSRAEENLPIDSIYTLGVGMVTMFERIAQTHGK